jgi:hypothetical protein
LTNPQGTVWESQVRDRALELRFDSARHPKRGQKHEPDVWVTVPGATRNPVIGALFWKRLVGTKGNGPRQPDGERRVVVLAEEEFWLLLTLIDPEHEVRFEIQAKWAKALNVTRVLGGLRDWLKQHGPSYTEGAL